MKKGLALILAIMMVLSASAACAAYTAGTYTAMAKGMGGEFPVMVTFDENGATAIEVGEHMETPNLGTIPLEQLPGKIIEKQSVAVDIIGGATITSEALLAAVKDCVAQAGGDVDAWTAELEKETVVAEDVYADIVIAGGGAAGLTAGSHAKYNGVENVIVLEKTAICGGSAALSGGAITRSAMEGDPDGTMTADEMYDYCYALTEGGITGDIIRKYVDESPALWSWFVSLEGGKKINMFHNVPENVFTTFPDGGGMGMAAVLEKEANKSGVDVRKNHDVTSLITDEQGKVIGVKCINADGAEQNFYAKAVILATGGFANSEELLIRFAGENAGKYVERKGAGGANGDGILMAEAIGAQLHFGDNWDTTGMNNVWNSQVHYYTSQWYGLILNDEGKRIIREDEILPEIYEQMIYQIQDNHVKFHVVMTMEGFEAAGGTQEAVDKAVALGELTKYDTIEALAEGTGMPVDNLKATIETYAAAEKDEMGKLDQYMGKLNANGPFYAAPTHPVRSGTMGGLVINTKSEVLDTQNNPIPNLYAAGETANGSFYNNYHYICGQMNMHALVTGKQAALSAVELIK